MEELRTVTETVGRRKVVGLTEPERQHAAYFAKEARAVPEVVGANVAALRQAAGLTQGELAGAMAALGFSWVRQTVTEAESGRRPITVEELVGLCTYFEMPVQALLLAPGSTLPYYAVRLGDRVLIPRVWVYLVAPWNQKRPAPPWTRQAIDDVVGDLDRPWARIWRQRGKHPAAAFAASWEEMLSRRSALPGPIFVVVGNEPLGGRAERPPWGQQEPYIQLEPGSPFVARDEPEARKLMEWERAGKVRRISRQAAYRIRKQKRRS